MARCAIWTSAIAASRADQLADHTPRPDAVQIIEMKVACAAATQTAQSLRSVGAMTAPAVIHPAVIAMTRHFLTLLDTQLPGQLEAFYLVGSIAHGDYREGQSDVDFVAVLAEPVDLSALATAHAELARAFPGRDCDGIYLRPGELSQPPCGQGIEVRAGKVNSTSVDERHPVVWLILADSGIALRGRVPDASWIASDRAAAIVYSQANLQSYWRRWVEKRRLLISPAGALLLTDFAIAWGCLGIARLHATIVTGSVPSKSGAGEYALTAFPDHARIITEALRLRRAPAAPSPYRSPLTRRRDLILFMDAVLATNGV